MSASITVPSHQTDGSLRRHSQSRHHLGFWMIAFAFLIAMAFSAVPAPLYPLYQARDGFSTFIVTVIFAVYAFGVVISLVFAGHISDWVGRKKILVPALVLELAAATLFFAVPGLWALLVARFISGLGIGMLTATATAHLHDLDVRHRPGASTQRFEIVSTAANIGGVGIGPLVSGLLAQFLVEPLHTPYLVFGILIVVSIVAVLLTPETVEDHLVRPTYRPQRVSADHGDRVGYIAALASGFVAFAVFGVFTSIAPAFVGSLLDRPSRAISGLVVFAVFGAAAIAQTATSRLGLKKRQTGGLIAVAIGLVVLVIGMIGTNLPTLLTGGVFAGAGAGMLFKAAVGAVAAMASPERRGGALAGLFLISYVGLSVPALAIGIATLAISSTAAMTGLTVVLLITLAIVGTLTRRSPRQ
ncbi:MULTISPECIES: MFS transporter [Arthrobacter]|uniref:MFS family permease n=1 Tax=Arthrobacter bambusae TaxID=1338426 RepID=A0AAW8DCI9_9MICC|nr:MULTISPECIES: MFS transporter [Arthrobacter]MDP9906052.1 MFS family permease [Arthrobacter bambusae]MDQ0131153.1 MFS family permease [Arthrobacter bambusae]MDQ0181855.1 MFS family permease [Arthrobacter bambusae]